MSFSVSPRLGLMATRKGRSFRLTEIHDGYVVLTSIDNPREQFKLAWPGATKPTEKKR